MKNSNRLILALGFVAAVSAAAEVTRLNENIAVSSTAAPDYRREITERDGLRPETYVFTPGRFFENGTRESGMERITFGDLTKILATNLARQRYYPTKQADTADLVIVVHWGASTIYEDPQKDFTIPALTVATAAYNASMAENGFADTAPLDHLSDSLQLAHDGAARAVARNAALLGYARELARIHQAGDFVSAKENSLRAELGEERYFVVLMAYDYQSFKKVKQAKLRWVTRLSVRTPGNNFAEALPVLSQAGSHVFGRQLDELVHLKANIRAGRVSLGELKFLGLADEPPAEAKKTP